MNPQYRCLACLGVYAALQPDGTTYHHVCPPLIDKRTGATTNRAGHRDENIRVDRRREVIGIVSEGAGVEKASLNAGAEPEWIAKLKKQLPREEEE